MIRTIILIILVAVIFYCAAAGSVRADEKAHANAPVHLRAGPPVTKELFDTIQAKDAAVFGVDFRARRQLVPGTLPVYALANYGAVEAGRHNFHAIEDGKPGRMTELAQFLRIWKNDHSQRETLAGS